jgi:UDP-N-acetyl-D-glucosamine dehydrogenase
MAFGFRAEDVTISMKTVCIQGLGFVGSAMAVAVASAIGKDGKSLYRVIGVDLDNSLGRMRVNSLSQGVFPFSTTDHELREATYKTYQQGNLTATCDPDAFKEADYIIVSVAFGIDSLTDANKSFLLDDFKRAIHTFSERMSPHCLVIVETTVPPGTCRNIILPIIQESFLKNGHKPEDVLLCHSYERVMPGKDYLKSITDFHRCYAGHNKHAAKLCKSFLSTIINVEKWPLSELKTLESSEIAKVLENSYRAINIALIEEWAEFSEKLGVDLNEVVDAIRLRPTHSNIRQPGFGVGGYCLTKDPLYASLGSENILNLKGFKFPFCDLAVQVNQQMPLRCLKRVQEQLGSLHNKKLLLMGISYREDIGDTRHSPAEIFYRAAIAKGATVICHDPLVEKWSELDIQVETDIHQLHPAEFDAIIFGVAHQSYKELNLKEWLGQSQPLIVDASRLLSEGVIQELIEREHNIFVMGRGKA